MLAAIIISIVVVGITLMIHYEILRLASEMLPRLPLPVRMRVIFVVFAAFLAHTVEVWLWAGVYFLFVEELHFASFAGSEMTGAFSDYVYYSAITYTSLGWGDAFAIGQARLLTGVESLTGLLLIGWSASFTYLTMETFWPLHAATRRSLRKL
jgi:ion channel